ncbi:unnamed protein product, partial [Discosporangium mesarthrocarpum]
PSVVSYNTALGALEQEGQAEKALSLLRDMQKRGLGPDVRSYNVVLTALSAKVRGLFYIVL